MKPICIRVRLVVVATLCAGIAASCRDSSPVAVDSQETIAGSGTSFSVSPAEVDFGSSDTLAIVRVTNTTNKDLLIEVSENATWLVVRPTSKTVPGQKTLKLKLSADRAGKTPGTYTTQLTISSNSGGSVTVAVSMTVSKFSVSPSAVDFASTDTTAAVSVTNKSNSDLSIRMSENASWLSVKPTSATVPGQSTRWLKLKADRAGLAAGTYSTKLTVSTASAGSATVLVSMTVPSTTTSVALAGQVIDQYTGGGMAGLKVQFDGKSTTTDLKGYFTIPGTASTTLRDLTVSGTGIYRRLTFARSSDNSWRVVPSTFQMTAFDDMAREFTPGTVRWVSRPTVYVDTRAEGFEPGPELDQWISEVRIQAAAFVSEWTGANVTALDVKVGPSPPSDLTPGTIVIHFSEKSERYNNSSSVVGITRLSWWADNSIAAAATWLRYKRYSGSVYASYRKAILGHEMGHAIGMGHMDGSTSSLMTPAIILAGLTAFDQKAGLFLYTRSPKNASPDTDNEASYRGALVPAGPPVVQEWICGAP